MNVECKNNDFYFCNEDKIHIKEVTREPTRTSIEIFYVCDSVDYSHRV